MHQTQSKEHILSLEFFKDSIQLYTQKNFLKFIENPTQIYTETFDDDTLTPLLTNLILFFKTLIITNRLSKLWTCVAECITENTDKLCEVYSKEIKPSEPISLSPQQQQQPHCVIRDKDLANINLRKIKIITLSFEACVKGLNDVSVYNLFSSKMNETECMNPFTGEEFILCYASSDKTYNVIESIMTPKDERHTLEIK